MTAPDTTASTDAAFAASSVRFAQLLAWLDGTDAAGLTHAELEAELDAAGRHLLRRLLQDHLDLRAYRETRVAVVDVDGVAHRAVEAGHTRALATIFGQVTVTRAAYRRKGHANLHPADAALNLPVERHSHGLRRLAGVEATRGSFDATVDAIERPGRPWANARRRRSLPAPWSTSMPSTRSVGHRPPTPATCSSCRVTARASSCAPTRCHAARPLQRMDPSLATLSA